MGINVFHILNLKACQVFRDEMILLALWSWRIATIIILNSVVISASDGCQSIKTNIRYAIGSGDVLDRLSMYWGRNCCEMKVLLRNVRIHVLQIWKNKKNPDKSVNKENCVYGTYWQKRLEALHWMLIDNTYFDGLMKDCSNSSAWATKLRQSCTKLSIYQVWVVVFLHQIKSNSMYSR